MDPRLAPGVFVRHPEAPDWGLGQVQAVIGSRITVTFRHRGQVMIDGRTIDLDVVDQLDAGPGEAPD